MSGCRWRTYLAIGGLAAVILLLPITSYGQAAGQPETNQPEGITEEAPIDGEEETGQNKEQTAQDKPPAPAIPLDDSIDAPPGDGITAERQPNTGDQGEQRAESDLRAQWWMAWAAVAQIVLTISAIFLLWKTLEATRAAITEAKNATKAAEAAVNVTRESAERQLRAYVALDNKSFKVSGAAPTSGPIVSASVVNTGQTPAYDLRHWIGIGFYEIPLARTLDEGTFSARKTISPGGSAIIEITKKEALTPEQAKASEAGKGAIYVWGRVEYQDAFKKSQFVNFRLVADRIMDSTGGRFMWLPDGNDAS